MATITNSIIVQRPEEEVFAFVTDARNNPQWQSQSGLRRTIQAPDGPVGVGTRVIETWRYMGWESTSTSEVTGYAPNQRYVRTQIGSSGPIASGELRVEPVAGGTLLTSSATLRARGPMLLMAPLLARAMRRAHAANLLTLKHLLEAGGAEQPQPLDWR